jgi:hypothetical protein
VAFQVRRVCACSSRDGTAMAGGNQASGSSRATEMSIKRGGVSMTSRICSSGSWFGLCL